jgi:probable HAF family extracellular repeat protein
MVSSVFADDPPDYTVSSLDSLGGTVSRGNSLNNRGWVAGYSNLAGDQARRAVVWRNDSSHTLIDLGTLGGPNSSVTWNVKNNRGLIAGIAQTDIPDPLGEAWSSAAFFPGPNNVGFICLGFAYKNGQMHALPTLGGNNGFAAGANNRGEIVGWAENTCHDPLCVPPQVLQFRPVIYGPRANQIRELPLISGDSSGAATAINDRGQAVGISGICDQAVGRYTAIHAVLWHKGSVTDIGNLGAGFWNTPTAINERAVIAGFAGDPAFPEGDLVHAFMWTESDGIQALPELPGHVYSEASGVNQAGTVVGMSCDPDFADCRAVRWDDGVVTDLNTLKQADFAPRLENAKDINDAGEITGRAIDAVTGVRTTFLAQPND